MRRKLYIAISIFMLFSSGMLNVVSAKSGYPYSCCSDEIDDWRFYKLYCTSYAAWAVNDDGTEFSNGMKGPNGTTGWFGDASNWDNNAVKIGFSVDSNPRAGDIAVWEGGYKDAGEVGHVAYVESVNADGSVNFSEYNWYLNPYEYNTRTENLSLKYIHFNSCTPPSSGTWNITSDCDITSNITAPGDVSVSNGAILNVKNGATLNIDLVNHKLTVTQDSKVLIDSTSKID